MVKLGKKTIGRYDYNLGGVSENKSALNYFDIFKADKKLNCPTTKLKVSASVYLIRFSNNNELAFLTWLTWT